ncbi:MAG: glycosyltransferase family 9 protein, partial [Betaproteobacteria bacterium]|nr:glycosyltransferase family 9 protein [Betaproteobacteria bacterium]
MKILVIKRDKLGDLLLATPMLGHLRDCLPEAEIHLLANDYNAWVVDGNKDIDRLWVSRRVRHAGRIRVVAAIQHLAQDFALRRARFDWVIVANGEESPRATARGLAVRGARCVAYCNDASIYPRLSDPLPVRKDIHESDRMVAMLAPLGIAPPAIARMPSYLLPASASGFAREWLAARGVQANGYIVLGLGARRPKKQPSAGQILRWSEHFKASLGLDTVFMWTPGDSGSALYPGDDDVAQPVLDRRVPYIHPFRGPIQEALGLIWSARTSLFPDSGLMHFAAASPGGVTGFFAETDVSPSPVQWAPRGPRADYIEA